VDISHVVHVLDAQTRLPIGRIDNQVDTDFVDISHVVTVLDAQTRLPIGRIDDEVDIDFVDVSHIVNRIDAQVDTARVDVGYLLGNRGEN